MLFKFASCSDLTSPPNTEAQKRVLICACLCGARTGGRRRVRVLAVEELEIAVAEAEMHLFASRRSERHAQARRITAGPIPAY